MKCDMQTNVLEYLEQTAERVPDKISFADDTSALSFGEVSKRSQQIGCHLASYQAAHEPVFVYMKRSPETLTAFFGVIYAGCYYVPIDEEMPRRRIELILENTKAKYLIYDESTCDKVSELDFSGRSFSYEECISFPLDHEKLARIRENSLDEDPIYVLFTSGSTGIPKGVVGHHRGVIDYIESLTEALPFSKDTVFGNQTPLYLDACMKEIYPTLKYGAMTWLIPKEQFAIPVKLVEYLNEHKINTICWVVSALTMISTFGTFDVIKPEYLHTIAFGSEVFPIQQFNRWKETLPHARFYNLYGPTEATGMSCYYYADRLFQESESIPIGKPFKNTRVYLLDQEGKEVPKGENGEICISGTCLTHGYYNNPEKTAEVFTQNPLTPFYPQRIYHTGDIGRWNEDGNLMFISREDHQIKHMGHRIELGEIEADAGRIDGVTTCCCLYIKENNKIVLFYAGDTDKKHLTAALKERLPRYMLPNAIVQTDQLPLTANGKMDRQKMQEIYLEQKKNRRPKKG